MTDGAVISGNWLCVRVLGVGNNQTMCQAKRSKRSFAGLTDGMIISGKGIFC